MGLGDILLSRGYLFVQATIGKVAYDPGVVLRHVRIMLSGMSGLWFGERHVGIVVYAECTY